MKREGNPELIFPFKSWFIWHTCYFCQMEFRRENGWRKLVWHGEIYSCSTCCPTRKDFEDRWLNRIRPKAAKAPPPRVVRPGA